MYIDIHSIWNILFSIENRIVSNPCNLASRSFCASENRKSCLNHNQFAQNHHQRCSRYPRLDARISDQDYLGYSLADMQASGTDVKIVKVPMTSELLRGLFDDGSRKTVTVNQYIAHVVWLYRGLFGLDEIHNFDWLKGSERVLDYLAITYADKPSMQATGINPLLVIVKKEYPKDRELYQTYYQQYQAVRESMKKARPPPQVMTESEFRNWKTLEQINERRVELQRRVNQYVLPKPPHELTIEDKVTLIRYLVLCLCTYSPAVRGDYSELPIIRFESIESPAAKLLMAENGNYLLEYAKGQFRVVLKDYKTVKTYGEQHIDLPTRSNNVVSESLAVFPRKYLLSRMRTPDAPMSRNYLAKFCANIFPDANVGTCLLRKICESNTIKDAPSIAEREQLAKQMLHSSTMQMVTYEKKYLPDGTKIQFASVSMYTIFIEV
jgi:hypothetical protein